MYSVKDFMSISWDIGKVSADISTIEVATKVWFEYKNFYWWGGVKESGTDYKYLPLEYDTNKDVIVKSSQGIIWDIEKVYRNYPMGYNDNNHPFIYDSSNEAYDSVIISKVQYIMETDLDLDGVYSSYRDSGKLAFQGDYRHTYPSINISFDGLTLRGYFDGDIKGFLGVKITPTVVADGTRLNDIDFQFR